MIEILMRVIGAIFIEFIGIIIGGIIGKFLTFIGLCAIKLVTFNKETVKELKIKYKDSIMPPLLGLFIIIGGFYYLFLL